MVRPFVAIGTVLRTAASARRASWRPISTPASCWSRTWTTACSAAQSPSAPRRPSSGAPPSTPWCACAACPCLPSFPLPDGSSSRLPRRDRAAFEIEIELLLDWLWPELEGAPATEDVRAEFRAVWAPIIDRLLALPGGWFLRDYHSPNLVWMPEREGAARVSILDFQDALNEHFSFDLVSLLQDARVDVPERWRCELIDYYCARSQRTSRPSTVPSSRSAYADFGAQRNTRLLGLWARLLRRDRKPHYLQHLPRTWGYLARSLRHVTLAPLAAWYERYFPESERARTACALMRLGGRRADLGRSR